MKNIFRYPFFFILLILTDRFLKYAFLENSVCNENIAWSIPIVPGVFYFLWAVIFFLLVYFFFKSKKSFEKVALAFILSGAISNLTDRILHGCVIDYVDLKFWPIFNLADIYITIGVMLLFIKYIKVSSRTTEHQNF